MIQPVSEAQYTLLAGTVAGTTVIGHTANLYRIVLNGQKTGTVTFYDVDVGTGTTATNRVITVENTIGTIPTALEVGARFRTGITAVSGGTVDMTLIWN